MAQAAQNMDVLASADNIKILSNVLKTNVSACTSIGSFYLPQIGRIFLDMLGLYKAVSGIISETISKEGEHFQLFVLTSSFNLCIYLYVRSHRYQNAENPPIAHGEKGDFEAHGDVHQKGGRS